MSALRYTLLADGSSDRCLRWIINWRLADAPELSRCGFIPQLADLRMLREPPRILSERITQAMRQFPCDLLFVHRDAEGQPRESRIEEISEAVAALCIPCHVPIVPVRMTEAWLLLEENAIRRAADNPNGDVRLDLPRVADLENIVRPKELLDNLLIKASEKSGRRKDQFERGLSSHRQRVAELIRDFSPLRQLIAFQAFERDLEVAIARCIAHA